MDNRVPVYALAASIANITPHEYMDDPARFFEWISYQNTWPFCTLFYTLSYRASHLQERVKIHFMTIEKSRVKAAMK